MYTLILRISAIIILVSILEKIPFSIDAVYSTWESNPNISAILFNIAPGIFALIISFLLWFFPSTLSSKFPNPNHSSVTDENSFKLVSEIIISVVGLYVLATAIPDLIYHITLTVISNSENLDILPVDRAAFVATFVEIIVGLSLLYGSNIVHKFIQGIKKEINEKSL